MGIAREGAPAICAVGLLALFSALWGWYLMFLIFAAAALSTALFFRDPRRIPPAGPGSIVSAADGRVIDISEKRLTPYEEPFVCVGVFMSLFDVHVNRSPVEAEVIALEHSPGQFRAAFRDQASEHNERNLVVMRDKNGRLFAVMQIAGYFARRIVCRVKPRQWVNKGERIGLIMFGSRVDHYVPRDYAITVRVGDRVRAGETVIGELRK